MKSILIVSLLTIALFVFLLCRYLLPDVTRLLFAHGTKLWGGRSASIRFHSEIIATLVISILIASAAVLFKGCMAAIVAWMTASDIVEFSTVLRGTYSFTTDIQHPIHNMTMFFVAPLLKMLTTIVFLKMMNYYMVQVHHCYQDLYNSSDEFYFSAIGILWIISVEIFWHAQHIHLLNLTANIAYTMLDKLAYIVFFLSLFWVKLSVQNSRKLSHSIDKYLTTNTLERIIMRPVWMIVTSYIVVLLMSVPNFLGLQWLRRDILLLALFLAVAGVTFVMMKLLFSRAWNFMSAIIFDVHCDALKDNADQSDRLQRMMRLFTIGMATIMVIFSFFFIKPAFMFLCLVIAFWALALLAIGVAYLLTYVVGDFLRRIIGHNDSSYFEADDIATYLKSVCLSLSKSLQFVLPMALLSFLLITILPKTLPELAMNSSVVDGNGDVLYIDESQDYYVPLHIDEIPDFLKKSLVFQEDRSFFNQSSFLPNRSNWHGLSIGFLKGRGGSNINCQLVKNYTFLSSSGYPKDISRKACDMIGAYMLSLTMSAEEILEKYVNIASFHGARGFRGLNAASLYAFGKPVAKLNELQQLYLVSTLPRSNYLQDLSIGSISYKNIHTDQNGIAKQILVKKAKKMRNNNGISQKDYNKLLAADLDFTNCKYRSGISTGTRILLAGMTENGRHDSHITLTTERAINTAFEKFRASRIYRKNGSELQTAALVVDVKTGHLLGHFTTGVVDYTQYRNGFPIGSLSKPAIILEMLALGGSRNLTLYDGQVGNRQTPRNAEGTWSNRYVNITEMLSHSLNAPFVNIRDIMNAKTVFTRVESSYSQMGINSDETDLSLCNDIYNYPLGNRLITMMEVAELYQTIMNGGLHIPITIMSDEQVAPRQIYDPQNIRIVKDALKETVLNGTMKSYNTILPQHKTFYSKTGTSSRQKDGWCVLSDGNVLIITWASYARQNGDNMKLGTESLYGSSTAGLFSVLIYKELQKNNN